MALTFNPYPYVPPPNPHPDYSLIGNNLQTAIQAFVQQKQSQDQKEQLRQQKILELAKLGDEGGQDALDRYKALGGTIPSAAPASPWAGVWSHLFGNPAPSNASGAPSVAAPGTALASTQALPRTDTSGSTFTPTEIENAAQQSLPDQHPMIAPATFAAAPPAPNMTPANSPMSPSPALPAPQSAASAAAPAGGPTPPTLNQPQSVFDITPAHLAQIRAQKGSKGEKDYIEQAKLADEHAKAVNSEQENAPGTYDAAGAVFSPYGAAGSAALDQLKKAFPNGQIPKWARAEALSALAGSAKGDYYGNVGDIKEQQLRQSLMKDARDAMNPMFQGGAGKEQVDRLFNIGRAQTLGQQMLTQAQAGDSRQMRELATSFARVLAGGGATAQSQVDELVPQTLRGSLSKVAEWITNNPVGTEQQTFVKRYMDSLAREKGVVQDQIRQTAESVAPTLTTLKQRYPADYQTVVNSVMTNPLYNPSAAPVPGVAQGGAAVPPPPPKMPVVGELRGGYKFKGGNPADQNSWQLVSPS